ncbi:MAG: UDP-2,3-diacylglucosamine diphosphatase LpxI [Planctomycetales bacterium]|nr:UDP-2,3-diacylglucosamine diphosphatase LpxI [Planctomycetales bacterium]
MSSPALSPSTLASPAPSPSAPPAVRLRPWSTPTAAEEDRVGIVAGWGNFPVEVAERLVAEGKQLVIVALKGHADPRLAQYATHIKWFGVLQIGGHMRFLAQHGVSRVAFAGKLFKDRILYHGLGWIAHLPDPTCLRILGGSFVTRSRDACDDTILSAVTTAFLAKGIDVLPITDIAPSLLAEEGCLTRKQPSRRQRLDIQFGWSIAQGMGALDVGQSITVKDQLVLAVEAIEGTDALLARSGKLCPRGGFSLIKVAKPQQDMRFDVPTIGLKTVQGLVQAGGQVIAIEAGRTLLVDRDAALAYADQHGVVIISLAGPAALDQDLG